MSRMLKLRVFSVLAVRAMAWTDENLMDLRDGMQMDHKTGRRTYVEQWQTWFYAFRAIADKQLIIRPVKHGDCDERLEFTGQVA